MSKSKKAKFDPEDESLGLTLAGVSEDLTKEMKQLMKERDKELEAQHTENRDQHHILHGYTDKEKNYRPGLLERVTIVEERCPEGTIARIEAIEVVEKDRADNKQKLKWMWAGICVTSPFVVALLALIGKLILAKLGIKM